jgi:hypothetical protein
MNQTNQTSQIFSWKITDWALLKHTLKTIYSPQIQFGSRLFKLEFNLENVNLGLICCNPCKPRNNLNGTLFVVGNDGSLAMVYRFSNKYQYMFPYYLGYLKYYLPMTKFERDFVSDDYVEFRIEFEFVDQMKREIFKPSIEKIDGLKPRVVVKRTKRRQTGGINRMDFSRFSPSAIKFLLDYIYNRDVIVPDDQIKEVQVLAKDFSEARLIEILDLDPMMDQLLVIALMTMRCPC